MGRSRPSRAALPPLETSRRCNDAGMRPFTPVEKLWKNPESRCTSCAYAVRSLWTASPPATCRSSLRAACRRVAKHGSEIRPVEAPPRRPEGARDLSGRPCEQAVDKTRKSVGKLLKCCAQPVDSWRDFPGKTAASRRSAALAAPKRHKARQAQGLPGFVRELPRGRDQNGISSSMSARLAPPPAGAAWGAGRCCGAGRWAGARCCGWRAGASS